MIDKKGVKDYIRECRSKEELKELDRLIKNNLSEVEMKKRRTYLG